MQQVTSFPYVFVRGKNLFSCLNAIYTNLYIIIQISAFFFEYASISDIF